MAIIPPIGATGASAITPTTTTSPVTKTDAAGAAARGDSFGELVSKNLDDLASKQGNADRLARDAATGKLQNIEEYMLAATDAQISTQLTVAVRNKAVEAFNDIMKMQV